MKKIQTTVIALMALLLTSCAPVLFGAAATTGVVVANNRTAGAFVEDEGIEIKLLSDLLDNIDSDVARFSAVSINRVVLLVGQAPDENMRDQILAIAENQENVRRVINEIKLAPIISLKRQAEDAFITTKVKTNFLQVQEGTFSSLNIKVLTEDGVVYLMGLDTKKNAAIAVEQARKVKGVRHVVKAFEYLASEPANS